MNAVLVLVMGPMGFCKGCNSIKYNKVGLN